ncbi:methyl-accepting chemotaxis protein [Thermopirellula anaerolimosa]
MRLQTKVVATSVGGIAVTATAIIALLLLNKGRLRDQVSVEVTALGQDSCKKIALDVEQMLNVYHKTLLQNLARSLSTAEYLVNQAGGLQFSQETAKWEAVNQFTKARQTVELPQARIGETPIDANTDPAVPSPIVDKVRELTGATCTIFQRMNSQGDMLRICTNVATIEGKRAIGTYIPAVEPGGTPNPVVATLLRGETYTGKAFVVNAWYVTTYKPIIDANRNVVGCLYVGVPRDEIAELRQAIMNIKVGKSGYVYVLQGSGEGRGKYVISQGGKRDGESIWDAKDAEGRYFIRTIVESALKLKPGECAIERYPWKNEGDASARWKVAAITYFEPWDWVIGVGAYEDDFQDALQRVDAAMNGMLWWTVGGGALVLLVCAGFAAWTARRTVAGLHRAVDMLKDIAQGEGDLTKRLDIHSKDEIGELAHWFNAFIGKLREMIRQVIESAEQFTEGAKIVAESSQTVAQGAQTQAAGVEEMSAAIEELSRSVDAVRALAVEADELARKSSHSAQEGGTAVEKSITAMNAIRESSKRIGDIIQVISEIAGQTNLLALNAAIEAARAGEHGMGFAVVADEVRKLAERSNHAAQEIAQLIRESTRLVEEGAELSDGMGEALRGILQGVEETAAKIGVIAQKAADQNSAAHEVRRAIEGIALVAEQSAAGSEEMASSSQELGAQADALRQLVSGFKT